MAESNEVYQYDPQVQLMDFTPERSALLAVMERQEQQMEQLGTVISHLETHLGELRVQRASLHHSYQVNKELLAPVSILPPETLGEIFLHCLPSPSESISLKQAPLLLMRVCRRWRRVAEGTPHLWTDLRLGQRLRLNPCVIIPMWLSNSSTLPIDIKMRPTHWPMQWDRHEVARLVVQSFHRFHGFDSELDTPLYKELFRQTNPVHAPLLKCLKICADDPISFPKGCIRAPHLTTLSLAHRRMVELLSSPPPLVCSITLDNFAAKTPSSLKFLTSYSNISYLKVTFDQARRPPATFQGSRILLPWLETLIVEFPPTHNPCSFLDGIEVPALRTLILGPPENQGKMLLPRLIRTLDSLLGPHPPLQELHVRRIVPRNWGTFLSVLYRLEGLHSLTLQCTTIEDSFLEALTPDASSSLSSWICPQLSTLDLTGTKHSWELCKRLVNGRPSMNPDMVSPNELRRFITL